MKNLLAWLMLLALAASACTTKSKATARAKEAFQAGQQQQAMTAAQNQAPTVTFRGDIKNPVVPWTEDLSLAAALVAAEYKGLWDPHSISITRNGQTYRVNPKRLLSGADNPPLEPGDIVEVRR